MANHTPGPWYYDENTGDVRLNDGEEVYPVIAQVDLDNVEDIEQGHADGRLIAAAPALKSALAGLLDWCREHTSPRGANSPRSLVVAAFNALLDAGPG